MAFSKVSSVPLTPNGTSASINTTGAKLIVAFIADESAASTFSDSQSNTWLLAAGTTGHSRTDGRMLYCINPSTSATHTFTSGGGDFPNIGIIAFTCSGTPQVDTTNKAVASSASTLQAGPVTPSASPALILAGCGFDNGTAAIVATDPGFTVDYSDGGAGGVAWGVALAYYLGWASGAVDPTWSTGASAMNVAVNAVFIEVAGGGGGGGVVYPTNVGQTHNRPGRGPYSLGRYFRSGIDAFTSAAVAAALSASPSAIATLSAGLTTAIRFAATPATVASVTAGLSTSIRPAAAMAAQSTITAALTTAIRPAAALADVSSVVAALTTSIAMAATPGAVATLTAALNGGAAALDATPAAIATVTGNLTTQIRLNGTPAAVSSLTAGLSTAIALAASPQGVSVVTGALSTSIRFAATPQAIATLSGTLNGTPAALAATPAAQASLTANLLTSIALQAAPAGQSAVTGALTTAIRFQAGPISVATLTADLTGGSSGNRSSSRIVFVGGSSRIVTPRQTSRIIIDQE